MSKFSEYVFIINAFVNLKICTQNSLWQKT